MIVLLLFIALFAFGSFESFDVSLCCFCNRKVIQPVKCTGASVFTSLLYVGLSWSWSILGVKVAG